MYWALYLTGTLPVLYYLIYFTTALYPLYQLKKTGFWIAGKADVCWMANYVLDFLIGALLIPYISHLTSRWYYPYFTNERPRWRDLLQASRWLCYIYTVILLSLNPIFVPSIHSDSLNHITCLYLNFLIYKMRILILISQ